MKRPILFCGPNSRVARYVTAFEFGTAPVDPADFGIICLHLTPKEYGGYTFSVRTRGKPYVGRISTHGSRFVHLTLDEFTELANKIVP